MGVLIYAYEMKTKSLLVALCLCLFVSKISGMDFSEQENAFLEELLQFRLTLRSYDTDDQVIEKVREFKSEKINQISTFSDEAQLVFTNMLATAEYNGFYAKDMHAPEMEGILRPQYEKIIAFRENVPVEEQNPWFVFTSADIINSMMQFLKQGEAISLGLKEKKEYAIALTAQPEHAFGNMLSGYWYYYAPGIGGGSKKKARLFFANALEYAANDYERFYGNINLSQMNFEDKNKEEAARLLDEAEKILPGTRHVAFIRKINEMGYSAFDYNQNSTRKKLDERLAEEK